jgi:hypothetical protein
LAIQIEIAGKNGGSAIEFFKSKTSKARANEPCCDIGRLDLSDGYLSFGIWRRVAEGKRVTVSGADNGARAKAAPRRSRRNRRRSISSFVAILSVGRSFVSGQARMARAPIKRLLNRNSPPNHW